MRTHRPILLALALSVASCSHLDSLAFWEDGEATPSEEGGDPVAASTAPSEPLAVAPMRRTPSPANVLGIDNKELELKLAKLWARVEELDEQTQRQKERIWVLEKGLLLGVIPEELKKRDIFREHQEELGGLPSTEETPRGDSEQSAMARAVDEAERAKPKGKAPPKAELTYDEEQSYQQKISQAQGLFAAGNYGQAIVAFSEIGRDYAETITHGNHKYWIGLSWYHLKEFHAAKENLKRFTDEHAGNPWLPKAKFYLAKTDYAMGLGERAVNQLRAVIQDYPDDEAAEMAKLEIRHIEQAL